MAEQVYRDFDFSFKNHPLSGDIVTTTNAESIKIALRNLLRLAPYDKPFRPEISSPLYRYLFEPMDDATATLIKSNIRFLLKEHEPRIENVLIDVKPVPEENRYEINMEFTVRKTESKETLSLFLPVERIR